MDDRRRTLAAITLIVGFVVFVAIIAGTLISGKKILSPVPDESAIRIIFISPSPTPKPELTTGTVTPTTTLKPTLSPKKSPTATPTNKPTLTPIPTPTE